MNYLCHAYRFLDDPYFAAGTGFPDWMNVIDRKNRARRQYAEPVAEDEQPEISAFAKGCIQHHDDDQWFHGNEVFVRLSTEFAVELREVIGTGMGHQSGFVGHISVELLLDSVLVERDHSLLARYYEMLGTIEVELIEAAANKICRRPVQSLGWLIPKFIDERFLADYQDDARLRMRLNGVMRRVGLPALPEGTIDWLATARVRVRQAADRLLSPN